ncbi:phage head completion protein [Aeromonas piscicola]|uniref:phage head completion protein n=1 Tax=Aeromonas piscicola TaxID=600645 RepID=UPI0012E028D3|nr:hypothetical protein [Aeromonas piscicola]
MRIGSMRHSVDILHREMTQDDYGSPKYQDKVFIKLKAQMTYDNQVDSDSKYDSKWAFRVVLKTRYISKIMDVMNSRDSYRVAWQGKFYKIITMDNWNNLNKYITLYLEQDRG